MKETSHITKLNYFIFLMLVFLSLVNITVSYPFDFMANGYAPSFKYEEVREMMEKDAGPVIQVRFIPDDGLRLREEFEKRYGKYGKDLIASFGSGIDAQDEYYNYEENENHDDEDINMLNLELKKGR